MKAKTTNVTLTDLSYSFLGNGQATFDLRFSGDKASIEIFLRVCNEIGLKMGKCDITIKSSDSIGTP